MTKCRLSAVAVLWLGAATTVLAEYTAHQEKPVIVTATRTAQTADASLASVTVISRKDIERQQARSIQDLFRGLPGISISNNGGPGKNTSVFMRGTESDHVLVMIDNVKVGSATSGTTAFENIPIEQIDRIEIVRGPRSSLYGSEAIGGVIHIFTRKGGGSLKPSLTFGGGSYSTFSGAVGLSGGGKQGWFNMTLSDISTKGFNACTGSSNAGCFSSNPDTDRDGYHNRAGTARAGYRFKNGLEIDTNFTHSAGRTQFDGNTFIPDNRGVLAQQVFGGSARYSPLDFWRLNVIAGRSRNESKTFFNNIRQSKFNSVRDTITIQNDFTLTKNHLLTIGSDYQNDSVNTSEDFAEDSRSNWGEFAQYQGSFAKHNVQLSVRHDDNQQFGNRVTGGGGWGYAINDKIRLTANIGTAFKAPTFNELYFPNFGNPDLRPEKSLSYEFGASGKMGWGNWSLNMYETYIDNLIAAILVDPNAFTFTAANIEKARIRGLEAVINTQIKGWQINGNLTLLNPENRSKTNNSANKGNILPRRAQQSFRLDANRIFFDKITFGAMFLAEGERQDDVANTRKLDPYAKFDLRLEYNVNKSLRLQLRVENIFNERYETASFYNQPGRNFFGTLRFQI